MFEYLALFGRVILLGYERIFVKWLSEKESSIGATFVFFGVATLFLAPFLLFFKTPNLYFVRYTLLSGFFYSIAFVFYVKSLSIGEASLVSPLYNFNILFLLILSVIFLGESLSTFKVFGIVLLFYGASFLKKGENLFLSLTLIFKDKSCIFMILSSLLIAMGRVVDGFVIRTVTPFVYSFSIYVTISVFLLFYLFLSKNLGEAKNIFLKKTKISLLSGAVNAFSYLFLLLAFTCLEVSVAEPFSLLSMIVTVLLAKIYFSEEIKSRLVGVIFMILGGWFLFL